MPSDEEVKTQKGLLREQMKESIETLSDAAKAQESERIAWVLEGLLRPPREECIAVYFPLGDEPDILPLIEAMLRAQQPLCAPRMEGKKLVMHRFSSLQELTKSAYGNLEPPAMSPRVAPPSSLGTSLDSARDYSGRHEDSAYRGAEPVIILVPGVAFDRERNRLGRGLGFYDRFIAEQRGGEAKPQEAGGRRGLASGGTKPEFLGVCFSLQLLESIPTLPHDQKVTRIVSADEIT